jgi:uncharacterized membrane protein HdeD (DUF308 family)
MRKHLFLRIIAGTQMAIGCLAVCVGVLSFISAISSNNDNDFIRGLSAVFCGLTLTGLGGAAFVLVDIEENTRSLCLRENSKEIAGPSPIVQADFSKLEG